MISHIILVIASFIGGILAAVASGGTFLTFPALMLTGLDARAANITSTLALYPMQVGTGFSGRKTASGTRNLSYKTLLIISFVGGMFGALLLLLTPPLSFARLVPYLTLFATLCFAWSSFRKHPLPDKAYIPKRQDRLGMLGSALAQFAISIYGGYFGGDIGFLMLAAFTYAGMNIRQAITTKNLHAAVINTSAVAIFLLSTQVHWLRIALVAISSMAGGIVGVRLIDRVNEKYLRNAVVAIGLILTIALFIDAKHGLR